MKSLIVAVVVLAPLSSYAIFGFGEDTLSEKRAKVCTRALSERGRSIESEKISELKAVHKYTSNGKEIESEGFATIAVNVAKNLLPGRCKTFEIRGWDVDLNSVMQSIPGEFTKDSVTMDDNCEAQAIIACLNILTQNRLSAVKKENKNATIASGFVKAESPIQYMYPNIKFNPNAATPPIVKAEGSNYTKLSEQCIYESDPVTRKAACDARDRLRSSSKQAAPNTGGRR